MRWEERAWESERGNERASELVTAATLACEPRNRKELCKPIKDRKSYIEVRDSFELLVSMVEMTYSLPYKYEDHTTAIMYCQVHGLVNAAIPA